MSKLLHKIFADIGLNVTISDFMQIPKFRERIMYGIPKYQIKYVCLIIDIKLNKIYVEKGVKFTPFCLIMIVLTFQAFCCSFPCLATCSKGFSMIPCSCCRPALVRGIFPYRAMLP